MVRDRGARAAYRGREQCRCVECGREPSNPIERAEVAMTWLLPDPASAGAVLERHFCRGCTPPGPVTDVACMRCGDGPLLSGDLVAGDTAATAVVQNWLAGRGWRLSGPVCPDCVGELAR